MTIYIHRYDYLTVLALGAWAFLWCFAGCELYAAGDTSASFVAIMIALTPLLHRCLKTIHVVADLDVNSKWSQPVSVTRVLATVGVIILCFVAIVAIAVR